MDEVLNTAVLVDSCGRAYVNFPVVAVFDSGGAIQYADDLLRSTLDIAGLLRRRTLKLVRTEVKATVKLPHLDSRKANRIRESMQVD